MLIDSVVHKVSGTIEWSMATGAIAVGVMTPDPAALIAGMTSINLEDLNAKILIITGGILYIITKGMDAIILFKKKYSETDAGQLQKCLADRDADRVTAAAVLFAEQKSHRDDIKRMTEQYEAMAKDFEDRLLTKRDEAKYLKELIDEARETQLELRDTNTNLTATIIQQNGQLALLASQSAATTKESVKATRRSVANTSAVIRQKSQGAVTPDPDCAVIQAPIDRVDVIVSPPKDEKGGKPDA